MLIPKNLQKALSYPKWKEAMQEEMKTLHKNNICDLVKLPNGKKVVEWKWVFTVKHKPGGSLERYKGRLVPKGFTQTYGIDYEETVAMVARKNSNRVLLLALANLDWSLHQFDMKSEFLREDLVEELYMEVPPRHEFSNSMSKVCKTISKSMAWAFFSELCRDSS
jgi:hypothetical protein